MALFYVGYLLAVSSTIAFILAILTPKWIYPNTLPVTSANPASPSETSYRGIFYVDYGYSNGTCRDWILTYKDSVAVCRPRMYLEHDCIIELFSNIFSVCRCLCLASHNSFFTINYSPLACWWLSLHSPPTSGSSFRNIYSGFDIVHL